MAFGDILKTKTATTPRGFGTISTPKLAPKPNLDTTQGLVQRADEIGLGAEARKITERKSKLSALQRVSKGLGALNTADFALTRKEKGTVQGVKTYLKGIGTGVASAVTGNDYEPNRRTFADVAEKIGVKNSIAKFGIGFLGDVLLDPSTYFGGAIAKGIGTGVKGSTNVGLKTIGKLAPEVETGLRMAGEGVKKAAGRAFVFGYGTSKGLPSKALEISSKLDKAKEGIVLSNLERLGTGTLSRSQQQELVEKLLAGKRAEFGAGKATAEGVTAARQAAQSSDPFVQKTIESQATRSQKFAAQAGLKDPFEIYFPGLKNDSVKNFLEGSRKLKVGSEGYKKQFKDLLKEDELIKNPAEAFATREFAMVKDNIVRDELRGIVKQYGKPLTAFKSSDEALKAGYQIVREKGSFGKELGYILETDKKFLDNLISPEFTTIDMIAKATGFDAVTSLFKRSVTGLFAPFHVRNFVSGQVQNFEVLGIDALNPKNIAAGQKMAAKLARGVKFNDKYLKAFSERFGSSSSYISDIGDATRGAGNIPGKILSKESFKTTVKTLGLGQQSIPFRTARAIGNFIETQQKATAYITALGQGKSIDEALDLATRAGFDYRALTQFESKVMRRLIPFYSFMRKNIELQLRTLGENPQRVNQVLKAFENLGDRPEEEERDALPDFIRDSLGVKLKDTPDGLKQYISQFGTPIEAFTELFNRNPVLKAISQTNPMLKVPVELGIGKDSFRQRDLKDVYDAREYKKAPQIVKDLLQIKEVQKPVWKRENGELKQVGERTQYVANPTRLLIARSLFTSRGVTYLDQLFGGDLQGFAKLLKTTTGIKPQQVDLEQQRYFQEQDKQRELEDMLIRNRGIRKFEKVYIPKND